MSQATALLGLIAETSLHAGAGSSVGVVDLPIQREGHNGWPCVFGSAVKGALRTVAEDRVTNPEDLFSVFGPDTKKASENAGALMVGDARLLLLPVRSLTTAFKWVTCPEALKRLNRDACRLGLSGRLALDVPDVGDTEALIHEGAGDLFLEEYRFTQRTEPKIGAMATTLACLMKRDGAEAELTKRLALVSDDVFADLARSATPVNAHITLDSATKTTTGGALWYEETLPPETLLYVPLMAVKARRQKSTLDAAAVLAQVTGLFAEKYWLQLGGNETVGMGWCAVSVLEG
ncbi:MAG: type III-B CRISPR module RAMP protein Cmr4 [Gammaproteobacteria bacterium]|nr:type III-B CRISPR module RAMP protein Cmr4 [Gammaproteobacteria bacterium]MBU1655932.1 type III-B CRISPR module RAMP protein Cmr4 [Gammaproteobacteria bacterium]MBU1961804.1 type III-B CRISPR module RAMP protein Cmr4 [Gammaproteobacteria bacterium]